MTRRQFTEQDARRQARGLLARSLPGSRDSVNAQKALAETVAAAIWRRFKVAPYLWRAKHVRWFLEVELRDRSPSTAYRYWLAVQRLAVALGRLDGWRTYLRGRWMRPSGNGLTPRGQGGKPITLPGTPLYDEQGCKRPGRN